VVLKKVSDHQNFIFFFCQRNQFPAFFGVKRQGFFNKNIFAGQQGFPGNAEMRFGRRGDHNTGDVLSGEYICQRDAGIDIGILAPEVGQGCFIFITNEL
jgi:hypothetical protein